jgi:UDP-N-acetylglucosamine transferase subunit ALG13
MIFLTIGTHEPFERLVRAVDDWCGAAPREMRVFGQITAIKPNDYHPRNFDWVARLDPAEYAEQMAAADLIVSHAGMGSIITALRIGKPIVIMPRRGHLKETRNDHQFITMKMMGERPGIFLAEDETGLGAAIDRALAALSGASAGQISALADPQFTTALRAFLTNEKESAS